MTSAEHTAEQDRKIAEPAIRSALRPKVAVCIVSSIGTCSKQDAHFRSNARAAGADPIKNKDLSETREPLAADDVKRSDTESWRPAPARRTGGSLSKGDGGESPDRD